MPAFSRTFFAPHLNPCGRARSAVVPQQVSDAVAQQDVQVVVRAIQVHIRRLASILLADRRRREGNTGVVTIALVTERGRMENSVDRLYKDAGRRAREHALGEVDRRETNGQRAILAVR